MIDQKLLRFTFTFIVLISIVSGILSYFAIPYQFYVWELYIDAKILAVAVLVFFLNRSKSIRFEKIQSQLFNWNFKKNIIFFLLPLFFYLLNNVLGILFKQVMLVKLDNAPTLILATLFDIPAFYVFSCTTILLEEIFFRGLILSSLLSQKSKVYAVVVSSSIWSLYSVSEIISTPELDIVKFLIILIFFFAIGMVCSILVHKYTSIWFGYSLRVGLISLTPISITSLLNESDSFFTTSSNLFVAEGLIFSIFLLLTGIIVNKYVVTETVTFQEKLEI